MHRLILVDDEPLAQIGMKSILDYSSLGIELAGAASNGAAALELIERVRPDIVITDIRMPVMDGLELAARCRERYGSLPKFIMLTGYEDFRYAREAVRVRASDYLVKMELTADALRRSLEKVLEEIHAEGSVPSPDAVPEDVFLNRFLSRLLNNVFISEEEIAGHLDSFGFRFEASLYLTVAAEILPEGRRSDDTEDALRRRYASVLGTLKVGLEKQLRCCVVAHTQNLVGIIAAMEADTPETHVEQALVRAGGLCRKYFAVEVRFGIGRVVKSKLALHESFSDAMRALRDPAGGEICRLSQSAPRDRFDMTALNRALVLALENDDQKLLRTMLERLTERVRGEDVRIEDAIDMVSGVIHLVLANLEGGESVLEDAFPDAPKSWLAIYSCQSLDQLLRCLSRIGDALCERMRSRQENPKHRLVQAARQYIRAHVQEKLTLHQVAAAISVSPNYLSTLFRKHGGQGFNEYVLAQKVARAQELLAERNLKVYQISEMLGFESAYYFSTVFKRMTGRSPSGG